MWEGGGKEEEREVRGRDGVRGMERENEEDEGLGKGREG